MIKAVIFDWAGTTVDYGCFAPLVSFVELFRRRGIHIAIEEARKPMGLEKRNHIHAICQMERVYNQWLEQYGKPPDEADVDSLYADFEPLLFSVLQEKAKPLPGVVQLVGHLRSKGIKIGSTTGYSSEMIAVVAAEAKRYGYAPDSIVSSTDVPAGRPFPWMCYQNAINLGVYPMNRIVKVGDTVADIEEGLNAGTWSIGVIKGSNDLGMTEQEVRDCDPVELQAKMDEVAQKFQAAGAHYVIAEISELASVIDDINLRLAQSGV